ncbi:hypothetical protein [Tautonia marina]|uniref:hypothetical protein n=1 Tax=Tautonia marina TaxID=2653855 RepID=UPI001260F1BC|nr:hypothetical protein [Tautonia marina]
MTALRGVRRVIAAPFYLTIPPVVSAVFAVVSAVAIGMVDWELLRDVTTSAAWLTLAAETWVVLVGGASAGLITGSIALQSARPTIDLDQGASWLGRASRAMVAGTIGGILTTLVMFILRTSVGPWAAGLLVVVLVIAGILWALVAIFRIPAELLNQSTGERTDDAPISGVRA